MRRTAGALAARRTAAASGELTPASTLIAACGRKLGALALIAMGTLPVRFRVLALLPASF